jgi:hypothetical protein
VDGLSVALRDPGKLAGMAADRAAFGEGAFGHPAHGTQASLDAHEACRRRRAAREVLPPGQREPDLRRRHRHEGGARARAARVRRLEAAAAPAARRRRDDARTQPVRPS